MKNKLQVKKSGKPGRNAVMADDDAVKIFIVSGKEITFVRPGGKQPVFPEYMQAAALEIKKILTAKETGEFELQQARVLIALPGDLLAFAAQGPLSGESTDLRVNRKNPHDPENTVSLEPGSHVLQTAQGEYLAERYGFVSLEGRRLSILSPIRINSEQLQVEWLVPARHPQGVNRQMLGFWLKDKGVRIPPVADLDDLIKTVNGGNDEARIYCITAGRAPVPGENGRVEWLVNAGRIFGKELPDGRIDFRERDYVVSVTANQLLACLKPPTRGIPGHDVKNRVLNAVDGTPLQFIAGHNIKEKQAGLDRQYTAAVDGVLHGTENMISVAKVLILPEGVNYKTGNIDFDGDVVVRGLMTAGFSIKAAGSVTVDGSVESGSDIMAHGDVSVGRSIVGRRTTVRAGGVLRAQNVHEATVTAGSDIVLDSYAFHARLRAGGCIRVKKRMVKHGGSIMGGEAWATAGIDTYSAGTPAWGHTELRAGILPEQSEGLDELQKNIEWRNAHIRQILDHFGLTGIHPDKIRGMIEQAEGIHRKSMALRATYLAKASRSLQELLVEREQIMAQIGPVPENVEIRIREKSYPNVVIIIGKEKRRLDAETGSIRFHMIETGLVAN